MSVNGYLYELGSSLVLSSAERESIRTSVNALKDRILRFWGSDVKEIKIYGSYERETILPRRVDENSDVDVMIVFNNPNEYKPQTLLNWLKDFSEYYYSQSQIHQSSPTIVLELNHIKFELTPAYIMYGWYYISRNASEWMNTDPDGFYSDLINCNKLNDNKVKPIIRLLKHWNITKNCRDLESFELEKQLAYSMNYAFLSCSTYSDYLKYAFNILRPITDFDRVDKALVHIDNSLSFEQLGNYTLAEHEIKKVFPEV